MFHFPGYRSLPPIEFRGRSCSMTRTGLPHSEISGSKPVCGSPKHIAAYHVLHRLLTPSHPPQTLRSLTFVFSRVTVYPLENGRTVVTYLKMFRLPYEVVKDQKIVGLKFCGPERSRTADLLLAKQALYQLSYRPETRSPPRKNGGPKRNCTSDPSVISTVLY
jgi:hypothetical protein